MWKTVKLGDVCTIKTGKKDVNEGNPKGEFPFFTCAKEHTYSDGYSFDCEAILIAGNGAVGQTTYYQGKFEAYQRTYVLSDFHLILPKLLLFILQGQLMRHLSSMVLGNTIPYIKKGMLQNFEFPLPPLAEQQRIVAKLDTAFAEIDRAILFAQDALDNGSHLRERTFEALFTKIGEQYGVIQLGDGIELISGQHIAAKDYNTEGVGMGYLTGPSDFGSINPVVTKFTTSPKKTAQKGDVLVTIKGSGIGKANIMVEQELAISRQLAAIRPVAFTSEFVFEFVKMQFEKLQSLGNGAAIPGLSREDIEKLEIPSPPLDLQRGILEQAISSASQVAQYEQCQIEKLKNLYQLKSAILAQELQSPQSEAA